MGFNKEVNMNILYQYMNKDDLYAYMTPIEMQTFAIKNLNFHKLRFNIYLEGEDHTSR